MIERFDFIRVGRLDDIRETGWIKVHLLGYEIVVVSDNKELLAIELGSLKSGALKSCLPDDSGFSPSGVKQIIKKLLSGPRDAQLGKLKHFPVKIDGDSVYVGISH